MTRTSGCRYTPNACRQLGSAVVFIMSPAPPCPGRGEAAMSERGGQSAADFGNMLPFGNPVSATYHELPAGIYRSAQAIRFTLSRCGSVLWNTQLEMNRADGHIMTRLILSHH